MQHSRQRACRAGGRLTKSVMSLPSTPVIVLVDVVTEPAPGGSSASSSKIAPMPSSLMAANAWRSSIGESQVRPLAGSLPSRPNRENTSTMRGSDRGSLPSVDSGSAWRPYSMV